jgi:hypothetical protein
MFNTGKEIFNSLENGNNIIGMKVSSSCSNEFEFNCIENWEGISIEINNNNIITEVSSWG